MAPFAGGVGFTFLNADAVKVAGTSNPSQNDRPVSKDGPSR
jgi:hypothetical protein